MTGCCVAGTGPAAASSSRGAAAADAKNWKYFLNKQHSASGGSHTLQTPTLAQESIVILEVFCMQEEVGFNNKPRHLRMKGTQRKVLKVGAG